MRKKLTTEFDVLVQSGSPIGFMCIRGNLVKISLGISKILAREQCLGPKKVPKKIFGADFEGFAGILRV